MTDVKLLVLARAASWPFETTAIVAAKYFSGQTEDNTQHMCL